MSGGKIIDILKHGQKDPSTEIVVQPLPRRTGRAARRSRNRRKRRAKKKQPQKRRVQARRRRPSLTAQEAIMASFSYHLRGFAEAVVHPFSPEAIGAMCPDQWSGPSIPITDRLTIDFDPSIYQISSLDLDGVLIAIVPRCLRAGWAQGTPPTDAAQNNGIKLQAPYMGTVGAPALGMAVPGGTNVKPDLIFDQYYLLIAGIRGDKYVWIGTNNREAASSGSATSIAVDGWANSAGNDTPGYNAIRFSRFGKYKGNCDKGRILGAGLKVWSNESPLNTGGTCYGGWITQDDLFKSLIGSGQFASSPPPSTIEDYIRFRFTSLGVGGSTVRYSPLQSPIQQEYVVPAVTTTAYNLAADAIWWSEEKENVDLTAFDQCKPGDFIPCCVWRYNTAMAGGVYNLRISAQMHIQGSPSGDSPFQTKTIRSDPNYLYCKSLIENLEDFPVAVGGHSFKSFMSKAPKLIAKMFKVSGHVNKFLGHASAFANTLQAMDWA